MRMIFECGSCGNRFFVEKDNIVKNFYARQCPNCGREIPDFVQTYSKSFVSMIEHQNSKGWQLYCIPDEILEGSIPAKLFFK